jgi:hypothetical protein
VRGVIKFLKSIAAHFYYIHFDGALDEKYAFEVVLLHPIRALSDGLTVWDCKLNADWYRGDHCPRFEFELIILNVMVVEMRVYNRHHVDGCQEES